MDDNLSRSLLLGLMAASMEPLKCCSDGRWRSISRCFPSQGLDRDMLDTLCRRGLVEFGPSLCIVTMLGREMLLQGEWTCDGPETPAQGTARAAAASLH